MSVARFSLIVACVLGLSGCGSMVYIDSANTFTSAGRSAITALTSASDDLSAARDKEKAQIIAADASCPVQRARIFVRQPAERRFAEALQKVPGLSTVPQCRTLATCDTSPKGKRECAGSCYSDAESFCIENLEGQMAVALKNASGSESERLLDSAKPLTNALIASEYKRTRPASAIILEAELAAVLEYFDLLNKSVDYPKSAVSDQAKSLSDRIKNASTQITNVTRTKLDASDQASLTKTENAITAFGVLINDAENIANANDAAEQIRSDVTKNSKHISALIGALKDLATGDEYLAATYQILAARSIRENIAKKYLATKNPYDRAALLEQHDAVTIAYPDEKIKKISQLFDAMSKANEALTQLVLYPSDKDRKAISDARFHEFKLIALDVVSIASLLK